MTRCGFVVSRRVGGAVVRNRVRRRLREIVRRTLPRLAPGWDLAVSARGHAAHAEFGQLRGAVELLLERGKLLRDESAPA